MYTACIFCQRKLGTNEALGAFPVGRRLAFDPQLGRLWVICHQCSRWNLTPLEERWEALEQAERAFRASRRVQSTDNIGLARLADGTDLVRVGSPPRHEFAAWRYGRQLVRRRREAVLLAGASTVVFGGIMAGGLQTGLLSVGALALGVQSYNLLYYLRYLGRRFVKIHDAHGRAMTLTRRELDDVRLRPIEKSWELHVAQEKAERTLAGNEALLACSLLLPHFNRVGGSSSELSDALAIIGATRDPHRVFCEASRIGGRANGPTLGELPRHVLLGLEMVSNEVTERLATRAELAALEDAWKSAEEVAAIADDLLVSDSITDFIRRAKKELQMR